MNQRRRLTGVVTSNKMTKTVLVEIGRTFQHPLYHKVVHLSKRVMAHDELDCQIGDQVLIVESQPISRNKRWVVQSIIKHEIRSADTAISEMVTEPEPDVLKPVPEEPVVEEPQAEEPQVEEPQAEEPVMEESVVEEPVVEEVSDEAPAEEES